MKENLIHRKISFSLDLAESQRMRLEMLEQIERYRTSSATPAVKEFEPPSPPPGSVNQELPSSSSEEALPTLPTVISEEESLSLPGAQDEESAPPPSTSSAVTETASPSSSAANDVPEPSLPASETLSPTPNTIPKVSDEYTKSLPPQSAAVPAEVGAGHFSLSIIKELQQGCQTLTLCLWLTCESWAGASTRKYYCGFNWTGRRSIGGCSCLAQPSN